MDKRIGILGGGQLGRMMVAAGSLLNLDMTILDVGQHTPAKQITSPRPPKTHIDGSFSDPAHILDLARQVDVLTVEIEHVNAGILKQIEENPSLNVQVHPSSKTISTIQDKFVQKEFLCEHGLPVAEYLKIEECTIEAVTSAASKLGLPLMLKSRTLAYDGRGNYVVRSLEPSSIQSAIQALGDGSRALYAEKWAHFEKEVAVMVVRSSTGDLKSYPAVETVHKENICHLVFAPLRGSTSGVGERARKVAESAVGCFTGAGVFGVELFLMKDGTLLINEIAPRPHNSGHYTIEACNTSQYENHLRAILGLPLGSTSLKVPSSIMLNLIGTSSSMESINSVVRAALEVPGATTHLYGKEECRKGRKMGHITIVGESDAVTREGLRKLLDVLSPSPSPSPSSSLLQTISITPSSSNSKSNPESESNLYSPTRPSPSHSHPFPLIGVIMGSDSDLPTLLPCTHILNTFNIPYELTIVSAHRTPDRMVQYARSARERGLRVIIAGAGGAAHLPGMVASETAVPVVGVPVMGSTLGGVDSLLSIVQMPRGIPVATMGVNNSTNAALLAIRILASSLPSSSLADGVEKYAKNLEEEVLGKVERLEEIGWDKYVKDVLKK